MWLFGSLKLAQHLPKLLGTLSQHICEHELACSVARYYADISAAGFLHWVWVQAVQLAIVWWIVDDRCRPTRAGLVGVGQQASYVLKMLCSFA